FASHNIHVPRVPGQKFAGKSGMGPRSDAILELDWQVGQIMQTMDSLDITQNTMVIFTSDNGPVLDDSFNMLPVLLGKSEEGRNQLVLQTNSPRPLALIQGDWKYIEPSKGPAMNKN